MTAHMDIAEVIRLACNVCNAAENTDVAPGAAKTLAATPVTPVTSEKISAEADTENAPECTAEWLQAQGVAPLREDVQHIARHLPINPAERADMLWRYVNTWLAAADAEPAAHRKSSTGRRAANIATLEGRLRN